jgi:hypothetical protein
MIYFFISSGCTRTHSQPVVPANKNCISHVQTKFISKRKQKGFFYKPSAVHHRCLAAAAIHYDFGSESNVCQVYLRQDWRLSCWGCWVCCWAGSGWWRVGQRGFGGRPSSSVWPLSSGLSSYRAGTSCCVMPEPRNSQSILTKGTIRHLVTLSPCQ